MKAFRSLTGWLLLVVAFGIWSFAQFRQGDAIRSDLLSLLPRQEQDSGAHAAVEHLSRSGGNRCFLLLQAPSLDKARQAAEKAAASLESSNEFSRVLLRIPAPDAKAVLAFFREAAPLLAPVEPTADLAERFLGRSYGAFTTVGTLSLAEDPFGFASDHFKGLPWPSSTLVWRDGCLSARTESGDAILIILELRPDSGEYARQVTTVRAIDEAAQAALAAEPSSALLRMGGVFYAEAAQTGARHDTDMIGIGSALGVVLLMLLCFRSVAMLATGLLSIAAGVVVGTTAVLLTFGEIHLITLVFGVSLIGEAADYSIQLVSARLSDEEAGRSGWLRRILPGLGMALATSLLGYAAMSLVPLPSLRQIAVFAFAGLSGAFLTVLLAGPPATDLLRGGAVSPYFGQLAAKIRSFGSRLGPVAIGVGLALGALGLLLDAGLRSDDDIRNLIHRPENLVRQEAAISKALGAGLSTQFILIHPELGDDESCLRTTERLRASLEDCRRSGHLAGWTSLADITPSVERQNQAATKYRDSLAKSRTKLEAAFAEVGLTPVKGFWEPAVRPLLLTDFLALNESTPFRHLRLLHEGKVRHIVTLRDVKDAAAIRVKLGEATDATLVDKASSISGLLGDVRRKGALWLGLALLLALATLSLRYGIARAALLLLPTAIGMAWAPLLASVCGVPFSIFGLMALILVLGVGVNYSIFLWEGGTNSKSALAGVIASCLTTLLSFGLLAFCSMPALSWLGTTLGFGILLSFLLTPLALAGNTKEQPSPALGGQ